MYKSSLLFLVAISVLLPNFLTSVQGQDLSLSRSGLVYGLGRVQRLKSSSIQIDLGDVHTLKPGEKVAIFRGKDNYYVPLGVVEVRETHPNFCQATKPSKVRPQVGDIAMFAREFSQLKTATEHRDDYARLTLLKNSGRNRYSTFGSVDVAVALADYGAHYDEWERSKRDVIGFMYGKSFVETREDGIAPLMRQINMMREIHRDGRKSLPAAGEGWKSVISTLSGPTARAQHLAAQQVVTDDEFVDAESSGPTIRDIKRQVRDTLFDKLDEEQKLLTYLVANLIEIAPRNTEVWFSHNLKQSQFPLLAEEPNLVEQVRAIQQALQSDNL